MIELFDNLSQLAVTAFCFVCTGVLFAKSHKQPFFLLACFYGAFSLGTLYWALHILLLQESPQMFYVSELGWVASYVFLLAIEITMSNPEERKVKTPLMLLPPLLFIPQFFLYLTRGDSFFNLLMCGITMVIAVYAVRSMVYIKKHKEKPQKAFWFHLTVLFFVVLEYALWTWSCFWVSDTLTNPYFWCDFLLSAVMLLLLPAMRKAAE